MDGQVAGDGEAISLFLDVRGLEGHGGEFLRVKEVGALEMAVALLVLRVDGGDIDGDCEGGFGVVGFDAIQYAGHSAELAFYVGDHHVLDLELGRGMGGIDVPGGGGGVRCHGVVLLSFIWMREGDIRCNKYPARENAGGGRGKPYA